MGDKHFLVYRYTNLITGQAYIGQTSNSLERRARGKYKTSKYFGPAIRQYGWENFKSEILIEVDDPRKADYYEDFYTRQFNTQWPNGYNVQSGRHLTEDRKKEISQWSQGNSFHKGKYHSEETKHRIALAGKGNQNAIRKAVLQFSLDGQFIAEYPSIQEAVRQTGIKHILDVLKGRRNKAGGFTFRYK